MAGPLVLLVLPISTIYELPSELRIFVVVPKTFQNM